jgi:hypothetical protein
MDGGGGRAAEASRGASRRAPSAHARSRRAQRGGSHAGCPARGRAHVGRNSKHDGGKPRAAEARRAPRQRASCSWQSPRGPPGIRSMTGNGGGLSCAPVRSGRAQRAGATWFARLEAEPTWVARPSKHDGRCKVGTGEPHRRNVERAGELQRARHVTSRRAARSALGTTWVAPLEAEPTWVARASKHDGDEGGDRRAAQKDAWTSGEGSSGHVGHAARAARRSPRGLPARIRAHVGGLRSTTGDECVFRSHLNAGSDGTRALIPMALERLFRRT